MLRETTRHVQGVRAVMETGVDSTPALSTRLVLARHCVGHWKSQGSSRLVQDTDKRQTSDHTVGPVWDDSYITSLSLHKNLEDRGFSNPFNK